MAAKKVTIVLTPPQARMVNSALSLLEAEDWGEGSVWEDSGLSFAVLKRTRAAVHSALDAAGVEP